MRELKHELNQLKKRLENAIIRIANALPIGETAKGEIVLLIIQGFVHQNEIKSSSYVVVCAPTGLDELHTDLEVKERQAKAVIKKVVRDAIERN